MLKHGNCLLVFTSPWPMMRSECSECAFSPQKTLTKLLTSLLNFLRKIKNGHDVQGIRNSFGSLFNLWSCLEKRKETEREDGDVGYPRSDPELIILDFSNFFSKILI